MPLGEMSPTHISTACRSTYSLHQKSWDFRSLTGICDTFGITRMVLFKTLDMLDHFAEEISSILRESY